VVVALLAGCGAGSAQAPAATSTPTRTPTRAAPSTTGELTREEACLNSHALNVGPARRVGPAVRLTFGDAAKNDPRPARYRVYRRPDDKSRPWSVVADLRRPPASTIVWTDTAAPPVALLYGVTVDADCGVPPPPDCDGGPCFFVGAPAVKD